MSFFSKQLIDIIEWTEPGDGILAYRYPMEDMEIQNGAQLTVRDSQMAVFVNEGRVADVFGPGLYTLTTHTLPMLTYLENWDKGFASPFKSDVYFFSQRMQTGQQWGTATPVTLRDSEFAAVRVRGFGVYAYRVADPKLVYEKLSGTREYYRVEDLEPQLRNTIVARLTDALAQASVPFLDLASHRDQLSQAVATFAKPSFAELGLSLETFTVESLSLPEELQKVLDDRISMSMVGDLGRYTQYQTARALPLAAENPGGGMGTGLGAGIGMSTGMAMAQNLMNAMKAGQTAGAGNAALATAAPVPSASTKFCLECGKSIAGVAKFCPECGASQTPA